MKIAFFEVSEKEKGIFLNSFQGKEVSIFDGKISKNNTKEMEGVEVLSVFVDSVVDREIIDALPSLKFIATRSTGFDHIDCAYAKEKGILVANVPAYGSHTVAEFAFGFILNFSRRIFENAQNYAKDFNPNYTPTSEGFDLCGKTLGVIGTGKIGKNVIKIAKGFGMKVVAFDLYKDLNFAKENDFEYVDLDILLSVSDFSTLHTPYSKENHHLLNREKILKMKNGSYLINTARGELVDTEAVIYGLEHKIIAGFASDVLEKEKQFRSEKKLSESNTLSEEDKKILSLNHRLFEMPNVIITPHIAFFTSEAVANILNTTILNINSYIEGKPINLV